MDSSNAGFMWGPSATTSAPMLAKNSSRWDHVQIWPEHPQDIPIVFGNLVYTVTTAVGILLPIENAMKLSVRPRYISIVCGAMLSALTLFLMVGILSNLAFGRQTETSITAQFVEHNIGDAVYISVVNIFLSISVILTYPLQFRPAASVVEKAFGVSATLPGAPPPGERGTSLQANVDTSTKWQKYGYIPIRVGLVTMTATLAASVPQLALVVSLAGSFTSSVLAMMIPPAMDFAVMRREQKYSLPRIVGNVILVFFGLIGLIAGTGASLLEILGIPLPGIPSNRPNKTLAAGCDYGLPGSDDCWNYDALPKVHPIMYGTQ
jgi:proton-coupled amino acid transporter